MRIKTQAFLTILFSSVVFLGSMVSNANASNGATVIDEFGCTLLSIDSGLDVTLYATGKTHAVVTPSGNTMLTCAFDIPEGHEPKPAINNTGFLCSTYGGTTYNSKSTATPGGKAILTCLINGSN